MPIKLTAEDFQRIEDKRLASVIRKVQMEKPITAREEALLAQARAGGSADPVLPAEPGFAKTWDELAIALSIEERALFNFRQKHAVEIKRAARTLTRADGRHHIAAWRAFADERGELKGRGLNDPELGSDAALDIRQMRLRQQLHDLENSELKLAQRKGEMLQLTEYQSALRLLVGAFDGTLRQLASRASDAIALRGRESALAMLRGLLTPKQFAKLDLNAAVLDTSAIVSILDAEIEILRAILAEANFLEPELVSSDAPPAL